MNFLACDSGTPSPAPPPYIRPLNNESILPRTDYRESAPYATLPKPTSRNTTRDCTLRKRTRTLNTYPTPINRQSPTYKKQPHPSSTSNHTIKHTTGYSTTPQYPITYPPKTQRTHTAPLGTYHFTATYASYEAESDDDAS